MGDELPLPGTLTFHTAAVGDHLSVYWPAGTWPWPEGPRQRGQYFAPSPSTSTIRTSAAPSPRPRSASGEAKNMAVAARISRRIMGIRIDVSFLLGRGFG